MSDSSPATIPLPARARAAADGGRYHGLDWLRAIAALLVVALHAGIAYTLAPFPGLAWPVHDANPSPLVDAATWWIDGLIMPVFLLMGGFVAAQLLAKRGAAAFVRHRVKRLLLPLVFGCVVILPMSLYVWLLGWVVEGRIPLKKLRTLAFDEGVADGLWGVGHLWFLEYLFLFSVAAAGLVWARERVRERSLARAPSPPAPPAPFPRKESVSRTEWSAEERGKDLRLRIDRTGVDGDASEAGASGKCVPKQELGNEGISVASCQLSVVSGNRRHPTLDPGAADPQRTTDNGQRMSPPLERAKAVIQFCIPFLFAAPSAVALFWEPRVVIGFDHAWHPLPANLLYYAPCFVCGWWLWRRRNRGMEIARWAEWHVALSLPLFVALLPLIREHCVAEFHGVRRGALAGMFALFAWLSAVGWFGLFLKRFGAPPRPVRYLAEASFWVYLFHHPIVGLAQVALAGSALPAAVKFVVVVGAAVSLSLLTYHALVRNTWAGVLLNGGRAVESRPAGEVREVAPLPVEPRPLRKTG